MVKLPKNWSIHEGGKSYKTEVKGESEERARVRMAFNYTRLLIAEDNFLWNQLLNTSESITKYEETIIAEKSDEELALILEDFNKQWSIHDGPPLSEGLNFNYINTILKTLEKRFSENI